MYIANENPIYKGAKREANARHTWAFRHDDVERQLLIYREEPGSI